jgi:pSer/pThr/pTyr-binding forkhead associated (FHA) protein
MRTSSAYVIRAVIVLLLLSVWLFPAGEIYLQAQGETPRLTVTGINVEQFPEVSLTVYGEGLGVTLANARLELLEDGIAQEAKGAMEDVGIQIALVLDASSNVAGPGQTGVPRLEEVRNVVSQLTQNRVLLEGKDWLSGIAFDRRENAAVPVVIAPWDIDHQAVINAFYGYEVNSANTLTPLIEQIFFALEQFNDARVPANLQRHMVVFSDGADLLSARQSDDLTRRAAELGVRVHTVQIGPSLAQPRDNLRRIADNTGGKFHAITAQTPQLDALWAQIKPSQSQRVLTYRSTRATPKEISVQTTTSNGALVRATRAFPAFPIDPPQVRIVRPQAGRIEKSAPAYNTPLIDLSPKEIEVGIAITWPDSRPRNIRTVEYTVNGSVRASTGGGANAATLSIADLDTGTHTLRVRATDELGLVGESAGISIEVVVNRPLPPPTPDLEATAVFLQGIADATATVERSIQQTSTAATAEADRATRTAEQTAIAATAQANNATATAERIAVNIQLTTEAEAAAARIEEVVGETTAVVYNLSLVTIGTSILAFIALVFAIVAWRNPRVRRRATEIVTGTIQAVTEPFFGGASRNSSGSAARARLTLLEGDPNLPATIDLFGGSTRLGRDPALVNEVIDDRRISRFHCRIGEEASGAFRIWDEGSTSGTYVNNERVDMSGRVLQPGDTIHIGPISYRFDPLTVMGAAPPTVAAGGMYDNTEPFIMTPGAQTGGATAPLTEAATQYDISAMDGATQVDLSNYASSAFDSTQYVVDDIDDDSFYDSQDKRRT